MAPGGEAMTPRRSLRSEAAAKPPAEEGAGASRELEARAGSAPLPAAVRGALELAEARRKLLAAEGRRQLVSELERRVHRLHRVFLEAELRLAGRAESLGRLGGGVAQAEVRLAAHGQRLKKALLRRRQKTKTTPPPPRGGPAGPASALGLGGCVPWAACRLSRRGPAPDPPESPFKRSLQAAAAAAASSPPRPPGTALP